ncbi:MAG: hypothetical protein RMX96_04105 [Nostoc sp. ChiSLP02]|nr:hypothetical protein [Nostoc sp. DedSLP05]MDZ8098155.1 hypothetical protein [Nostoc sp. DedSLP01]MDZ8184030.1 hypothetical protein [Nostoc sp. ChiSLP02]
MQPLKLIIEGDFWDCQIYRNRLYLWYMDGSVGVYRWDDIISSIFKDKIDDILVKSAFIEGDYLYKLNNQPILNDSEIKNLLLKKIKKLSAKNLLISNKKLKNFEYSRQDNIANDLPTDTEIYNNTLFVITDSGLIASAIHRQHTKYGVSTRSQKLWDCPLLSISASKNTIGMAAGDEGAFELHLNNYNYGIESLGLEEVDNKVYRVSNRHSSLVNWAFASLYISSYVSSGFLAAFGWDNNKNSNTQSQNRGFRRIIPDTEVFQKSGFSWGCQEKIYMANSNSIDVVNYTQSKVSNENKNAFSLVETFLNDSIPGRVISAGTAYFGVILEYDESLTVLCSDQKIINFYEPVVRWRVYPRSIRYENHLHVIYEDRLEIYSFNHDYFIKQEDKVMGIQYKEKRTNKNRG